MNAARLATFNTGIDTVNLHLPTLISEADATVFAFATSSLGLTHVQLTAQPEKSLTL
jgi:hypothetical protein